MADQGLQHREFGDITAQFCGITGVTEEVASHLLEACDGDLQMAIGMQMDGAGRGTPGGLGPTAEPNNEPPEPQQGDTADCMQEDIRAPIPQMNEQLIDEQVYAGGVAGRRRATRSVFDGFRDFQAETRHAEERARQSKSVPRNKKRTLEDLFRPPIDIIHKGSFQSAKDGGTASNKWLMVNIQNVQEFACQVLNRDVWSNPTIRDTIKYSFIFWQVYSDSEDGKRYMQFYKINQWPYVAIIDPQTGEHIVEWTKFDAPTLIKLINMFIADRPKPDGSTSESPPAKRAKREGPIVEASEDSQLEAAINASLKEPQRTAVTISSDDDLSDDDDDELETFSDSASETENAQNLDHSPITSKSIQQVKVSSKSDSDSNSGSEVMSTTKGKTSVNNRAKVKNGHCKTVYFESSSDEATSDGNSDRLPTNDDRLPANHDRLPANHDRLPANHDRLPANHDSLPTNDDSLPTNDDSYHGSNMEYVSQESQSLTSSWKDYLGNHSDSQTKLLLRYPDGTREPLTIPCSSQLRSVVQYVSEKEINLDKHELVTNFPRRNLSSMSLNQDLQEAGLHPQETIFVQEKS